jgi:hypothetical protein
MIILGPSIALMLLNFKFYAWALLCLGDVNKF